jgi:hypothetical protein
VFTVLCDSRQMQSTSTTTAVQLGDPLGKMLFLVMCRELGHFVSMKFVGNSYPMTAQGSVQQCDAMTKQHIAKGCPTLASGRDVTTSLSVTESSLCTSRNSFRGTKVKLGNKF